MRKGINKHLRHFRVQKLQKKTSFSYFLIEILYIMVFIQENTAEVIVCRVAIIYAQGDTTMDK